MLTGSAPFSTSEGPLALMYQHLQNPPPLLPDTIPAGIRTQVERLLAKTPQERPANALLVRQALEAALSGNDEQTATWTDGKSAALAETEVAARMAQQPVKSEPAFISHQRETGQGQGGAPVQSRARRPALWLYGTAGGLMVLALLLAGQ
ncbi:MAG: hypothetical protein HYZ72_03460 [Deltaproteobacteria bacterium]|nr:hypothetical protein [Deltaproteobacteria bacterium]